jgi:hypothetical protein
MPIDLDEALGAELAPIEFSWTSSDVQLYHLALGAGADPMIDNQPLVLPTFGCVAASFMRSNHRTSTGRCRHRTKQRAARVRTGDGARAVAAIR